MLLFWLLCVKNFKCQQYSLTNMQTKCKRILVWTANIQIGELKMTKKKRKHTNRWKYEILFALTYYFNFGSIFKYSTLFDLIPFQFIIYFSFFVCLCVTIRYKTINEKNINCSLVAFSFSPRNKNYQRFIWASNYFDFHAFIQTHIFLLWYCVLLR